VDALEDRFNGDIFPLNFEDEKTFGDFHVALVASVFKGDALYTPSILQRSIDFRDFEAYDFQYLPIELLSSIYELFLHSQEKGKQIGATIHQSFSRLSTFRSDSIKPLARG
jgi:hypothetical protein